MYAYVTSVKFIVSEICITGRYLLQIVAPSLASYVRHVDLVNWLLTL